MVEQIEDISNKRTIERIYVTIQDTSSARVFS